MARIHQNIEPSADFPSVVWRSDGVLETPRLTFPADEVKYCPDILLWYGASADVRLQWDSVSGASFYVVQICENSSFNGPSLRAAKTTNTYQDLNYIEDIRQNAKIFWRVAAYDGLGSASAMSNPRSMEITCGDLNGVGYDPDETPGTDSQLCDALGVKIEIMGPSQVRLVDNSRTWAVNVTHDCKDDASLDLEITDITAAITQVGTAVTVDTALDVTSGTGTGTGSVACPGHYLSLDIDATCPEAFDITFTVDFEVGTGSNARTFSCTATKKVMIEGDLGTATIRAARIDAIGDSDVGTGSDDVTTTSGIYRVELLEDIPAYTASDFVTEFQENMCCDIIDDDTGLYLDCQGYESTAYTGTGSDPGSSANNIRGDCVDELAGHGTQGAGTGVKVNALDLKGRQLGIGVDVIITKIDDGWIIIAARETFYKVCLLSDIECATDCDGTSVFLRTYTPVWVRRKCDPQSEFIPTCPDTGTGTGTGT